MKITIVWTGLLGLGLLICGVTACTVSFSPAQLRPPATEVTPTTAEMVNADALTPTVDATKAAAAEVIASALAAAPVMTTTQIALADQRSQASPTVELAVAATAAAQQVATAVAATLTAQPTATPTAPPTVPATATPDIAATQAAVAQQIATSVMATLMAKPTATLLPVATPTPAALIQNFATCFEPCRGDRSNLRRTFPERTTKVYLTWLFSNFPIGAHYTRSWTLVGQGEWTRYDCIWSGPTAGTENIALAAPSGLHSGTWEVTITVNETVVLREQLVIEGNWGLWDPPGLFTTCYGTR